MPSIQTGGPSECMSAWIKAANDEPQKEFITVWNNQQDIQFRPWRLLVDPNSQASRDKDFKSAFTNNPLKTCTGEVGALILSHSHLFAVPVENPSTGLVKALEDYRKLIYLFHVQIGNVPFVKGIGTGRTGMETGQTRMVESMKMTTPQIVMTKRRIRIKKIKKTRATRVTKMTKKMMEG